ncbi:cationic amino acid transporter 1-like [Canna indica]|uniref:Cationic amino acid transporter 1-like n=1 Tax=Canna indica TaxID=4628 RepID=A0AAQ3KD11_9LILI|nr:cationic amino acid transporter 1-like [Canna indica]
MRRSTSTSTPPSPSSSRSAARSGPNTSSPSVPSRHDHLLILLVAGHHHYRLLHDLLSKLLSISTLFIFMLVVVALIVRRYYVNNETSDAERAKLAIFLVLILAFSIVIEMYWTTTNKEWVGYLVTVPLWLLRPTCVLRYDEKRGSCYGEHRSSIQEARQDKRQVDPTNSLKATKKGASTSISLYGCMRQRVIARMQYKKVVMAMEPTRSMGMSHAGFLLLGHGGTALKPT